MPFTIAHPSIVFPFKWINKKYISLTALVIGSLAPDFEYFIWMSPSAYISHSIRGIFLFDLPLTILLAFLFHIVIKRPFLYHFPFLKNKYVLPPFDYAAYLRKNWLVFILSALIGIVTHLLWDALTHSQGYFVQRSNYLLQEINLGGFAIRRCYVAWYISSIAGLATVIFFVMDGKKLFSKNNFKEWSKRSARYWLMILLLAIGLILLRTYLGLMWNWFRHLVIIAMGAFMYAIIVISWLENNKLKKNLEPQ